MSCPFKEYKEIFGKENEGVHSYRLFDFAIIDVLFTIIGAFFLSYLFKINYFIILFILFILAILLHRLFCVNTTLNKLIFGIV